MGTTCSSAVVRCFLCSRCPSVVLLSPSCSKNITRENQADVLGTPAALPSVSGGSRKRTRPDLAAARPLSTSQEGFATLDPDRRRDFHPRFRAIAGLPDEWPSRRNDPSIGEERCRTIIERLQASQGDSPPAPRSHGHVIHEQDLHHKCPHLQHQPSAASQ